MVNALGKALRNLRMDRDWLLKEMADGVGVSSSFLSAIETGKKAIPDDLVDRIVKWGKLTRQEERALERAFAQSVEEVRIRLPKTLSADDREAAAVLARSFGSLPSDDLAAIRAIIDRRKA
ncbi:helix-turn-helix domain-containing protein [Methylorubrum populi]|uniref:HTH cro/C1-type domain-containing protein n=1 Tax=Methylorubrum populi TaxID=223967 RepID=A0A833J233_9HYPH|nr:helix-turn-helix transcriptional regulator [Methylorubrum populi]KAB7782196.1 hypothetical protein F8B43_4951 [Methylorubrum populi]